MLVASLNFGFHYQTAIGGVHIDLALAIIVTVIVYMLIDYGLGRIENDPIEYAKYRFSICLINAPVLMSSLIMVCLLWKSNPNIRLEFASGMVAMHVMIANSLIGLLMGNFLPIALEKFLVMKNKLEAERDVVINQRDCLKKTVDQLTSELGKHRTRVPRGHS
jgi:hypothetical protein